MPPVPPQAAQPAPAPLVRHAASWDCASWPVLLVAGGQAVAQLGSTFPLAATGQLSMQERYASQSGELPHWVTAVAQALVTHCPHALLPKLLVASTDASLTTPPEPPLPELQPVTKASTIPASVRLIGAPLYSTAVVRHSRSLRRDR
jgi:hypothetical protein